MVLMQISRAWVAPLKWQTGEHVSDHDRVGISLGKWNVGPVEVHKKCKGWNKKQIKEFKFLMSKWAKEKIIRDDVVNEYEELKLMMMKAFTQVEVSVRLKALKGRINGKNTLGIWRG